MVTKILPLIQKLNEPNPNGPTPIHNAICGGNFEVVQYLVRQGMDVNIKAS